ncbi:DMSO/TMAO reductase YedYZ molybdopterin-dependent catalytic subunit [Kitasatospora sp. MAP12-15]|uniref:molybdopterin-dependent oxidoreductase n=1 Tax=unclassified Kitasatospora TaxID=2633591 RepID=UPI002473111B|nr:molybdopterin-dependent oxidoreductase [Kitasatospora sp. MAP12-44]MDH6108325.1 DMSO/TMAO reductase YedYZ molybdopterin-dependent catalytic subunit [Kitasatospora sp. MAP12-44]
MGVIRWWVLPWLAQVAVGGVIGLITAGVAIGVGELFAVITGPGSVPVVAVGAAVIDLTPTSTQDYAIRSFGTSDKAVLLAGILILLGAIAVVAGTQALRRPWLGAAIVVGFGAMGAVAATTRPGAGISAMWPSVAGALAGTAAMLLLVLLYRRGWPPEAAEAEPAEPAEGVEAAEAAEAEGGAPAPSPAEARSRRGFVAVGAGSAAAAALAGFGGRALLSSRYDVSAARAAVRIPTPTHRAAPVPPAAHPAVAGLSPFFTPTDAFYRVDTALVLPQVDPRSWALRIRGMVDRPIELSFDDLLHQPLDEHDLTLSCVSNEVGGPLVGNARWIGASLAGLLRMAGVRAGADQLVGRSADGFTTGTPLEAVLDGREGLLAVAMNGEALPVVHGFPCRMLVPGFYGYAGATKWVVDLELTTFAAFDPYWVRRGWDRYGPMKTASRIDVPQGSARLTTGPVTVAGVAWATHRGIEAVEVRIDGGAWAQAQLADADGSDVWRQWTYDWLATPGTHRIEVRATDGTGAVQPETRLPPFPSGSTGWHTIVVTVS